jgi:uncharacterized protein YegJ (DUF2314 family)
MRILLALGWLALAPALTLHSAPLQPGSPLPAGDVRNEEGYVGVVFYYFPDPKKSTEATARELVLRFLPKVGFSTNKKGSAKAPFVGFIQEKAPLNDFVVPDAAYFKSAGHGLKPEDIAAFQKTSCATHLFLTVPKDEVWTTGRAFLELVHEFAVQTHAVIWDSATRECFSPDAWKEIRLGGWPAGEPIPDISQQITIHFYKPSDESPYLRAITLGMEKFALPDIVIEKMIGGDNRPGGSLINFICQSLAENPRIMEGTKQPFGFADLKNKRVLERCRTDLGQGATEKITLALLVGRPQEGDAENQLVEIDFRNAPGSTDDEKREAAFARLWGAMESVVEVKHDKEMLAASKRARERLPQLQSAFAKGLPPGARILVKAPFVRDDEGKEWMWVEVLQWPKTGKIDGILQNDPFYIKKLKSGSNVVVNEADVFDYILYRSDGETEGNETGKLMEEQGTKMEK